MCVEVRGGGGGGILPLMQKKKKKKKIGGGGEEKKKIVKVLACNYLRPLVLHRNVGAVSVSVNRLGRSGRSSSVKRVAHKLSFFYLGVGHLGFVGLH